MILLVTENRLPPWQLCRSSLGCLHIPREYASDKVGADGFGDKKAPEGAELLLPRVELTLEVAYVCFLA